MVYVFHHNYIYSISWFQSVGLGLCSHRSINQWPQIKTFCQKKPCLMYLELCVCVSVHTYMYVSLLLNPLTLCQTGAASSSQLWFSALLHALIHSHSVLGSSPSTNTYYLSERANYCTDLYAQKFLFIITIFKKCSHILSGRIIKLETAQAEDWTVAISPIVQMSFSTVMFLTFLSFFFVLFWRKIWCCAIQNPQIMVIKPDLNQNLTHERALSVSTGMFHVLMLPNDQK